MPFLLAVGAIVLVYLIIVVNFQSWLDSFIIIIIIIIITALPGALAGIVWMLFLTGTTLSIPALTGAIMCMGIATANSVLLVSFLVSFGRERLGEALRRGHRPNIIFNRPIEMRQPLNCKAPDLANPTPLRLTLQLLVTDITICYPIDYSPRERKSAKILRL
jgi:AcrB/AcrD/AcrF family